MDITTESAKTISVRVPGELHARLNALAEATGRDSQDVALEALQRFIEADAAYVALIEERRQEALAGKFATPERVAAVRAKYRRTERAG